MEFFLALTVPAPPRPYWFDYRLVYWSGLAHGPRDQAVL